MSDRDHRRTIAALRAIAERPGTPGEGAIARDRLAELEARHPKRTPHQAFADYLRSGSMSDLSDAVGEKRCDCGSYSRPFAPCPNAAEHQRIADEIRNKFPRGTRVYYNRWAYAANDPGVVVGYPKPGTLFCWIRIKLDRLKSARVVPVWSESGWHLSTEPIDRETLRETGLRGGMDR